MSDGLSEAEAVKHILGHIVTPVTGAAMAFGLSFGGSNSFAEWSLFVVAGAMLLFYGFNQTIEHADARLNGATSDHGVAVDE